MIFLAVRMTPARRAGTLASQLVHLESGLGSEELQPLDLVGLLQGLVEDWETPCRQAGVRLTFVPVTQQAEVWGNAALIGEVLSNLLDNALTHADASTITVSVDEVGFSVTDDGRGVEPEKLEQIFERFYRSENVATGGHGLGLSIVREFASRMQAEATAQVENGLKLSLRFKSATV